MSMPIAKIAGVAGWPIHQSLSPMMHNIWLREAGISGAYIPFAVHPNEAEYAFKSLKRTTLMGVNVTAPLKEIAFKSADIATADAKRLGVANVLYKRSGKLVAHNTDLEGFAAPLLSRGLHSHISQSPAVVIGAGGASRAVIAALLSLSVPEIRLTNRTDKRASDMADHLSVPSLYAVPWAERNEALRGAGLIINASSAGMAGKAELDISTAYIPEGAWVYDLVYNPQETRLLRDARRQGLNYMGGLDMLIAQARPSFKAFFGVTAPATDPSPYLIKALRGQ